MDANEIAARVRAFPRWHYEIDLKGIKTPIAEPRRVNRHHQRKLYFFDPLVEILGGSLKGKRVLDLGCNAGFWSLQAIQAECDFVLGIDGRESHIEQADLVFEALDVDRDRYEFVGGNVFDIDFTRFGSFDVVLFLGLLYHVVKPVELMEKISAVNGDVLVIDTRILERRESVFEFVNEGTSDPRNSAEYSMVFRPSGPAVVDLARMFGYEVHPLQPRFTDYTGAPDYEVGLRRAYLCAKLTSLAGL